MYVYRYEWINYTACTCMIKYSVCMYTDMNNLITRRSVHTALCTYIQYIYEILVWNDFRNNMYELQPVGVLPSISSSLSFVLFMRYPNITVLWDRNDPGRRLVNPTPIHIYIIYPKFILIHANKLRYAPLYSSALTNGCAYLIKGPRPSKFSAAFANPMIPSVSNS